MTRATVTLGQKTILLQVYRDSRGSQFEVITENWNKKRTGCARSVFMTADRRVAFLMFRTVRVEVSK